jgi:hypothetical protein
LTPRDAAAGASALPVVVLLATVEPALGLAAGYAVFLGVRSARVRLPRARMPRLTMRRPRAAR